MNYKFHIISKKRKQLQVKVLQQLLAKQQLLKQQLLAKKVQQLPKKLVKFI